MSARSSLLLATTFLLVAATLDVRSEDAPSHPADPVDRLATEARALSPLFDSALVQDFLAVVPELPRPETRTVWRHPDSGEVLPRAAVAELGRDLPEGFHELALDPDFYYTTRYGSPLAFALALEAAAAAGLELEPADRITDFGFGSIGQLRLLASLGHHAVGVDVDPLLGALYSEPGDTGPVRRAAAAPSGPPGSVTIRIGRFPVDPAVVAAVGTDLGLFVSKNTLKRGYVHPEREVDPRRLVHLGVDDEAFVAAVHRALRPGGFFVIANLHPAPAGPDEPYVPWADGRSPFQRGTLEAAGFDVLAFDRDDTAFARRVGAALGWGEQMDLGSDLFATVTIARRRPAAAEPPGHSGGGR